MQAFDGQSLELYLILSDLCNFSCAHCINISGPQSARWNLSEKELAELTHQITPGGKVKAVHFSGGEPTLRLPQIRQIQSRVRDNQVADISYAMTTNGWFADRSQSLLDEITLDELVISYDKFHRPFIEPEKLLRLARQAKSRGLDVALNFVFEEIEDLAEAEPFLEAGVKILSSRIISAGRANDFATSWRDLRVLDRSCPSMDPEQRRRADLEKVVHLPGQGFTPCCGPLAFDALAEPSFTFSPDLAHYDANPLRKALNLGSFRAQAEAVGLDLADVRMQSACDACRLLHGRLAPSVPSLGKLFAEAAASTSAPHPNYYAATTALDPTVEKLLGQRFVPSYVFTVPAEKVPTGHELPEGEVTAEALSAGTLDAALSFIESNYYARFPEHYGEPARAAFRAAGAEYLQPPFQGRGVIYRKAGQIVACLLANDYDEHPALRVSTLHIGYWGYDRDAVTETEAKAIRADWLARLSAWRGDASLVDVSIDSFNEDALGLAEGLGFARKMLRLDRKEWG